MERQLLCLPVKLGGMGISNITSISDIEYQASKKITNKVKYKKKTKTIITLKIEITFKKRRILQMSFMKTFSITFEPK